MTFQTRPRVNRDRPRPRINRDVELAAHGEARHRPRRDDLNFLKISEVAERLGVATRTVRRWIMPAVSSPTESAGSSASLRAICGHF